MHLSEASGAWLIRDRRLSWIAKAVVLLPEPRTDVEHCKRLGVPLDISLIEAISLKTVLQNYFLLSSILHVSPVELLINQPYKQGF